MLEILNQVKLPTIIIIFIIIILLSDKFFNMTERIWSILKNINKFCFKRYASVKLTNNVFKATKVIKNENINIIPYKAKIQWVDCETPESFFKNGQIIIKIKNDNDINRSFVLAVTEYINKGLIPFAKNILHDKHFVESINLYAVKKILSCENRDCYYLFENEILSNILKTDVLFENCFKKLLTIDKNGLFTVVFLNEIGKATSSIINGNEHKDFETDVKYLLTFLVNFCTTEKKVFNYKTKYFRFSFGLLANNETLAYKGEDFYQKKIIESIDKGANTCYLFAMGYKQSILNKIAQKAMREDQRINKINQYKYFQYSDEGRMIPVLCLELLMNEFYTQLDN